MPLNFAIVDAFVLEYREIMKDKALLRQERHRILSELRDHLQTSLNEHLAFEAEFHSWIIDKIDKAKGYPQLMETHRRAIAGVENYFRQEDTIVDVHDLFRIIRDQLTIKVLKLVESEMEAEGYGRPPTSYAWGGLGSEGRDEQTVTTDQDNLLIYREREDDFATDYLKERCQEYLKNQGVPTMGAVTPKMALDYYYQVFSEKAVEGLDQIGFERCKGGVMPSNEKWRGSVHDWHLRIYDRLTYEKGIFDTLDVIILTDARFIAGERTILEGFMRNYFEILTENKHVMKDLYSSAVLMPTALSFFGNFKVEKSGPHKDTLNIKLHGWAPLILAVRMVAITNGIYETNTLRRIKLLRQKGVIKKDLEAELTEAYLVFVRFRLANQIERGNDGADLANYLRPDTLTVEEQGRLRKAMKAVEAFQKYIQETLLFGEPI
jgi:CBS domain-containing protein